MGQGMNRKETNQWQGFFKKWSKDLFAFKIELELENRVIADIRERQRKIPNLKQDNLKYTAIWGEGGINTWM